MTQNGPRWTKYCVSTSATALFAVSGSVSAFATQKHAFQHRDTLSSIARAYHVSVRDLEQANHLDRADDIRDGRILIIPDPPKRVALKPTMRHSARSKGDRISLRLGPGSDYRRVAYIDDGSPLTVTAQKGDWFQIELDSGRTGWVREDYVNPGAHLQHERKVASAGHQTQRHSAHETDSKQIAHRSSRPDAGLAHADHKKRTHSAHRQEIAQAETRHKQVAEHGDGRHRRMHGNGALGIANAAKAHEKAILAAAHHHGRHHDIAAATHQTSRHHTAHEVAVLHNRKHRNEIARESYGRSDDLVRTAYAYRGTPYVYGGAGRGGFDCSGFTSYLYGKKGISLPHSARAQFQMGRHVGKDGLKPGDLVFFHTVTPGISHVGMYVGNGRFVHASSRRSGGVRVDNLGSGYYSSAYRGARRFR